MSHNDGAEEPGGVSKGIKPEVSVGGGVSSGDAGGGVSSGGAGGVAPTAANELPGGIQEHNEDDEGDSKLPGGYQEHNI